MQSFDKINPQSILENTMLEIRSKIISGELKSGHMLPSERDMAEQMGISRSTLHQAILELQYQGFVNIIPRRGTEVCDFRKHPTAHSLQAIMSSDSLNIEHSLFKDLMEFRLFVESECAKLACSNAYESTLNEMETLAQEMAREDADSAYLSFLFHYKLTQASGNSIMSMAFRGFEGLITQLIDSHYTKHPEDIAISANKRKDLVELIRNGNEEEASAKVREIITQGVSILEEKYNK